MMLTANTILITEQGHCSLSQLGDKKLLTSQGIHLAPTITSSIDTEVFKLSLLTNSGIETYTEIGGEIKLLSDVTVNVSDLEVRRQEIVPALDANDLPLIDEEGNPVMTTQVVEGSKLKVHNYSGCEYLEVIEKESIGIQSVFSIAEEVLLSCGLVN